MKTTMSYSPFNAAQLFLLQTFAHIKSEETLEELKAVLFKSPLSSQCASTNLTLIFNRI